ncbi:acyl-CoA thioesterase [Mycolicibacterium goodii]|uniref:Thioesterase family protein n=1 Tax=Mycolicibacterium goodii TaxID=134601 RepID=A0ABS6HYP0_MYCGD|nr:thioesterase family protein [Mycolicibacterium goodii]MBU8816284.1 thioesterase family protein [Mycolicibacterium goodii]MBU8827685.1 thioesterase family protein [Mycolicibacterium goodii]MBU8841420.1 thioesterase family protein [Mycolicibacterium goodii]
MRTGQRTGHPLDAVIDIQSDGGRGASGWTVPEYGNMVGPFGGATAAFILRVLDAQADRLGEPVALTVTYAAPIADGEFHVDVELVRTNRTNQHWTATLTQDGDVKSTATAVFGLRRGVWSDTEAVMPAVGEPPSYPPATWPLGVAFLGNYDVRVIDGAPPEDEPPASSSLSTFWVRHDPARRLDFPALAALADIFYPRVFLRLGRSVPAGTVSMTTYFHAGAAELERVGDAYILATARAQRFAGGYFDQTAQLWSRDGVLLATTNQIVYYKDSR